MSMTLRYDVGNETVRVITDVEPLAFLGLDLHEVSRWGGLHNPRRECQCFSVHLPSQVLLAMQLRATCLGLVNTDETLPASVRGGCRTISKHLTAALGLSPLPMWAAEEDGFMQAVLSEPGELGHWMAYADWLSEQRDLRQRKRGELIAGWLGPKALKVKNGILPVLAAEIARL